MCRQYEKNCEYSYINLSISTIKLFCNVNIDLSISTTIWMFFKNMSFVVIVRNTVNISKTIFGYVVNNASIPTTI